MQPSHVRKRDGRLVEFDQDKLRDSIRKALLAAGDHEAEYSDDIAYAISMHLGKTFPQQPPQTADIAAAVARALEKTCSPRASALYLDHRVAMQERRSRCQVVKPVQLSLLDADSTINVMSGQEQNARPWNRTLIVRALEQEAHVPRNTAESIAQAVEQRVLSSELPVVTTTLIRALVDSELVARKYTSALRQRSSVTIPYDTLERGLRTPEKLGRTLSQSVAIPYALSHIYSEDVAMAHRQGLIGIGGLEHPFARRRERFAPGPSDDGRTFRRQWAAARQLMESGLCGEIACLISGEFLKSQSPERLLELRDTATLLSGQVTISLPLAAARDILPLLKGGEEEANLTWHFHGDTTAPEVPEILTDYAARGHNVACARSAPASLAQIVSVNVPQKVYKKGGIEDILTGLRTSLEAAVHAHRQYRLWAQANSRLRLSDQAGCELLGLREAAAAFAGEDHGAQLKMAGAIMEAAAEIVHRLSAAYYFDMQLVAGLDSGSGGRFALVDQRLFPEVFGFDFLPFGALDTDTVRQSIPPYRSLEAQAGDSRAEIMNWNALAASRCDDGLFNLPAGTAGKELVRELLATGFGLRLAGENPGAGAFTAPEDRGQSLFL